MTRTEKIQEVRNKLKNLSEEEKAKLQATYGVVTIEGHALSPFNTMLVAVQNPASSVVGGFRQWKKAGRYVKKGESGMVIWVPGKKKETNPDEDDMFFFTATVFDISQTMEIAENERS